MLKIIPPPSAHVPSVMWAERKDKLFITIDVPDCADAKVDIAEDGKLTFKGTGGTEKQQYEVALELLKPVNSKDSKIAITPRNIFLIVQKTESGPYWGRLLAGKGKPPHFVKLDWSRYKDEDEEDAAADHGGFDMSQLDDLSARFLPCALFPRSGNRSPKDLLSCPEIWRRNGRHGRHGRHGRNGRHGLWRHGHGRGGR